MDGEGWIEFSAANEREWALVFALRRHMKKTLCFQVQAGTRMKMEKNGNLFCLTLLLFSAYLLKICQTKPPVVIVPGDAGSRLQARLHKKSSPHFWCLKNSDWFQIWLSVEELLPEVIDCWSDNMKLVYNATTRQLTNPDGVEIRTPYFGGTEGIEYLDGTIDHPGEYFAPLVQSLVNIGYARGKTLFGAPYDFRFAPNSNKDYFNKLEKLIEDVSAKNNGSQVILISHSLGCPYTKFFLDNHNQEWKDKFVHSWITVAGAWGGSAKLFCVLSSGTDLGVPKYILEPIKLRPPTRMFGSSAYLLPSEKFWKKDEPFIITPEKNYTLSNLPEFYKDIDFEAGHEIKKDCPPVWSDHPPNVTLYCFYGIKVPTPESFKFRDREFPDTFPEYNLGDGDGTVNIRSLRGCKEYIGKQVPPITVKEYPGAEHSEIIGDKRVIDDITKILDGLE